MTTATVCPYCGDAHALSSCPRWRITGRPDVAGRAENTALMGQEESAAEARAGAGMRGQMPQCAAMVDGLREAFGQTVIDAILRATSKGQRRAYFAELGADGQLHEWGRAPSGRRAEIVEGRLVLPC